ncbi:hypothetical protein ACQ0QQ_04380 [Lysinibacillus sphaericus]
MALMKAVNLISEFTLKSNCSAIASWIIVALFFINARYVFSKQTNGR